jgi:hypothetical protein
MYLAMLAISAQLTAVGGNSAASCWTLACRSMELIGRLLDELLIFLLPLLITRQIRSGGGWVAVGYPLTITTDPSVFLTTGSHNSPQTNHDNYAENQNKYGMGDFHDTIVAEATKNRPEAALCSTISIALREGLSIVTIAKMQFLSRPWT